MVFPFPVNSDRKRMRFQDDFVTTHSRKRKKDACQLDDRIKTKKIKSAMDSEKSLDVIVDKGAEKNTNYLNFEKNIKIKTKNTQAITDLSTNSINTSSNFKKVYKQKKECSNSTKINKPIKLCKLDKKISDNRTKLLKPTNVIFNTNEMEINLRTKINHNSKCMEDNLLIKKQLSKSQRKKMKKKLKKINVEHSKTDLSFHETKSISDCAEIKITEKLKKINVEKPKKKKIKKNFIEISPTEHLKTHSSCKTESEIIDGRKITKKSLLLLKKNNDEKAKLKKNKKKFKEISTDEHPEIHSTCKTQSDSIGKIKITKKALLKKNNAGKPKMKEIKKKLKEISTAEHLKSHSSCYKEKSIFDFTDKKKVTKKSLPYKNNSDEPNIKKIKKKFNAIFAVEREPISYNIDQEKVSKKELKTNNLQINKKKSNVSTNSYVSSNASDSSSEEIFVSDNDQGNSKGDDESSNVSDSSLAEIFVSDDDQGDSDDDEELALDIKNSKEFKNLMRFIEREEKQSDQSHKIVKNAGCETKEEFTFESNDQETFVSTKLNHSDNNNKFIVPLNIKQNVSSKTNSLSKSNVLKNKAQKCLQAARFRLLNEKLYTVSGKEALEYFKTHTDDFKDYHEGYQSQVMKWPLNPVDVIIKDLYHKSTNLVIADMGCGEAKIATTFPDRKISSFDLVALNKHVTRCEFSKVNLSNESVDIVVFCLSLMGTNLKDYLCEAHRILKFGGELKIAEVESRIENLSQFVKSVEYFGFQLVKQNVAHKVFVFLDFSKVKKNFQKGKVPTITLKACMYKKR